MSDDASSPVGWSAAQGERLRQRRIALGLRQQDVADRVHQPRTVVSNWENGSRAPSPTSREMLAIALQVSVQDIDLAPAHAVASPRVTGPDRWRDMWPVVNGYLGPGGQSRLKIFTRQVDIFQRLATAEFAQARWHQLHAATASLRVELQETIRNVGAQGKGPWADDGAELAAVVRRFLQLGTGPLPSLTVTAELCGIRVFLVAVPDGTSGQLRGLVCPVDGLGAAALINSDLDPELRLSTLARLLGSVLLSTSASIVITAANTTAGATKRPRGRHATVTAFADEFVLPPSALVSCANTVRRMTVLSPEGPGDLFERNALEELISTYRARRSATYSRYLNVLGRPRSTWAAEATSSQTAGDGNRNAAYGGFSDARPPYADRRELERAGFTKRPGISPGKPRKSLPYRPRLADLPRGFVDLLLAELAAKRFSIAAIAELTGIDEREIEGRAAPHAANHFDDVAEQEFSVA